MAEVLVKMVVELLSILSIATKEVKMPRASELVQRDMLCASPISCFSELFSSKLLGMTDIEDALKRLDSLIQEEVQMAIALILIATTHWGQIRYAALLTNHNITLYARLLGANNPNEAMQRMSNDMGQVKCDAMKVKLDTGEVKCS